MPTRYRVFALILLLIFAGLMASACRTGLPPSLIGRAEAEELKSNQPRDVVQAPAEDLATLTSGNAAFALDLYHALGQQEGNLFFSPHSISQALAMTYAGAAGQTAGQMRPTLHFTLPDERLHAAFNALDTRLTTREQTDELGVPPESLFTLRQANALWGQRDHTFRPAFLDLLAQHYGAGLRVLDFKRAPEPARAQINAWVEEQTQQKIKDLMPDGSITGDTRLVLANAIYFKAKWIVPFDPTFTKDGPFTRMDGSKVTVPLMNLTSSLGYNAGPEFQAVQLGYYGNVAMVVLLPAAERFADFETALTAERLQEILDGLQPRDVWLTLPKLNYTSPNFGLKPTLEALGMADAFAPGRAD